ncbi:GIY-YIG nuclease family protein [Cytobacillus purgationiresistens]|uniref:ABC-type uncharacterized transport system auxiliary subunit n=1 Tax=Cytobacillus purgationiresistens TaxID=863449 RepID=A0ABU0ANR1_9BACI|nr:GIY-YIG nuclease family protein [Cytobacillus purgationiresistens]MDQ0272670.1 ABC-type uncharacterized transport system auxiliary subunit [Cytobacillus purgationiresistens]
MDRKKELKQLYKESEIEAGVYQIKNKQTGKVFVASTPNLKTLNGKKFMLKNGTFINKELQADWNRAGEDAFEITVLEVLKKKKDGYFNEKIELEKLEEKWLEQLQPFGDKGYN